MLAQIVDATTDHFSVELLAKMKKISIERSKTKIVGTKQGDLSTGGAVDEHDMLPTAEFLTGATPQHFSMHDTPMRYGASTPGGFGDSTPLGSRTPGGRLDDIWSVNARDGLLQGGWNESNASDISGGHFSDDSRHSIESNQVAWSLGDNSGGSSGQFGASYRQSNHSATSPSSNAYSPFSAMGSPSVFPDNRAGIADNWVLNMVVVIIHGSFASKNAVIRRLPDEFSRKIKVQIRENGGLVGAPFDIDPQDVRPAEIHKNVAVQVISGQHQGRIGDVKAIASSDLIVQLRELRSGEVEKDRTIMVKHNQAVWIS